MSDHRSTTGVPLVSFSGGLDSTCLLYHLLLSNRQVDIIIGRMTFKDEQNKREDAAIKFVLAEFDKLNKEEPYKFGKIRCRNEVPNSGICAGGGVTQGIGWIANAALFVRDDTNSVNMGYVKGDSALTVFHYLVQAWEPLLRYTEQTFFNNTIPYLTAPLRYCDKPSLFKYIPSKVLKKVSWCESNKPGNDCGKCSSCERMISDIAGYKELAPHEWEGFALKTRYAKMLRNRRAKPKNLNLVEVTPLGE